MKKSTVKTGQEGAKATAQLKMLSMAVATNSTGFLPNLKYRYNRVVSATASTYIVLYSDISVTEERLEQEDIVGS